MPQPTHPPVDKILCFAFWFHVLNIPCKFLCRKKKNNMLITVALHDSKSLSFLENISPAVFHYLSTTEPGLTSKDQFKDVVINILLLQ